MIDCLLPLPSVIPPPSLRPPPRPAAPRPESPYVFSTGKLREEGVREILRRRIAGEQIDTIAVAVGVGVGTVGSICRGKTHADIHAEFIKRATIPRGRKAAKAVREGAAGAADA